MEQTAAPEVLSSNHIVLLIIGGIILILAIFGVLAVLISILNYKETPVRDRLMMLKDKGTTFDAGQRNSGAFDDLKEALITYSGPISQKLYGENQKLQREIKQLLTEAGLPDTETHVWAFLTNMVAAGLTAGIILGALGLLASGFNIAMAAVGLMVGFIVGTKLPKFQLHGRTKSRKTEIRFALPDSLDLMVVCVEAGLGLDATIQRVAEETERMAPEISQEFKRLNKELNAGISRVEAFQNMGQRAGVDELRSLCAMIVQADKMGTSVSDTLRVYADDLRVKRKQKAEELASKASIKMTFPLVLFIFPPMFIVLIGPTVIMAMQQFFPSK
jgi:tight adherence protein C